MIVQGPEVASWVYEAVGSAIGPNTVGLGYVRDKRIVAGFAFESYNGVNIIAHQRQDEMAPKGFWVAAADYCFNKCNLKRVTGMVNASNEKAIRLNKHIGYEIEGVMKNAADDGGDILIMVLWRDKCRILNWK